MASYDRLRRQQLLREIEGYLDLVTACEETLVLDSAIRDRLLRRALLLLERIDVHSPDREIVLCLKGQALRCMERYHEAIVPLEEAAELNPENLHVWLALGWCQKRTGRLDLAIQALEEGLSVAPDQAIIYYNLACYWSLANNVKLAVAYLTRAFDMDAAYRDRVNSEPDFDPIRHDPRFLELTSVIV